MQGWFGSLDGLEEVHWSFLCFTACIRCCHVFLLRRSDKPQLCFPSQCVESVSYFVFVLIVFTLNIEVYYKVSSVCCLIQKYIKMYVCKEEFLILYFICAPQVALLLKSQNFIEGKKRLQMGWQVGNDRDSCETN